MGWLRFPDRDFDNHPDNSFDISASNRITRTPGLVIAAFSLAVLFATVGCTSSSLSSTAPSAAKCQIAVTGTSTPIAAAGGTAMVSIAAAPECAWTASTDVAWITDLAPAAGQGNSAVQVRAATNADPVIRRGMVHIAANDVQITQAAALCVFQLSALSRDVGANGGSTAVSVTASGACGWTAASTVSWIQITAGASGTGNGTVTLAVHTNAGPARSGGITIAGQQFTVNQAALVCTYSINPTSKTFTLTGGTGVVQVTAPAACTWTAVSNTDWVDVTSGASGSGNGTVTFSAAGSGGDKNRNGTITIAAQTFTVMEKK